MEQGSTDFHAAPFMDDPVIDIFISAASEDFGPAREVYLYLQGLGLKCFLSDVSLEDMGVSEYKRVIDHHLERCTHLVVVASRREHVEKLWVYYEWNTFANERLSGRKQGNLVTATCDSLAPSDLPLGLRQTQVISWPHQKQRLPLYFGARPGWETTPAAAEGRIGKSEMSGAERLAAIGRFYWRAPIWKLPDGPKPWIARLVQGGDFLLRLARLQLLVAGTVAPVLTPIQDGLTAENVGLGFVAAAFFGWVGWLSAGRGGK
jgi:hypothetical protein